MTPSATSHRLEAALGELTRLRALVDAAAAAAPASLDEAARRAIVLAANEAFVNVVKHALRDVAAGTDRSVVLELEPSPSALEVRLRHRGVHFDPAQVAPPDFDGTREGGFGVFLIANSVDEVDYTSRPDGERVVRMIKRARPAG